MFLLPIDGLREHVSSEPLSIAERALVIYRDESIGCESLAEAREIARLEAEHESTLSDNGPAAREARRAEARAALAAASAPRYLTEDDVPDFVPGHLVAEVLAGTSTGDAITRDFERSVGMTLAEYRAAELAKYNDPARVVEPYPSWLD